MKSVSRKNNKLTSTIENINLPIQSTIPELQKVLDYGQTAIMTAPPGAGKSTLVPLKLLDAAWLAGKKILMLEPRRLAARMIASRMADLLNEKAGETVGYRIRLDTRISDKTRIEVVTEGILTRMLQSDNSLLDYGLVIFDEFHERSIHADTALAFCRESQQVLRPDLRILIMSATIDVAKLSQLLKAKTITGTGKQFPVEVKYAGESDIYHLPELTVRLAVQASREYDGDILIFLPGESEIKKCEELLRKNLPGVLVHPLFGRLSQGRQNAAVFPDKNGRRKVVLATSIAETSLTIEGIKIVIDSGFGRTSKFDPRSGLTRLETVLISRDSADQRTGRAGRLSKGVCYRMWTKASHLNRPSNRNPEIIEADLTSLALELKVWGVSDPGELTWVTPPPTGSLMSSFKLLEELGAIENDKITVHGRKMHQVPAHPRIAHLLLMAKQEGLLPLATDLAALLEERDPLPQQDSGIDINLRIEALRRFRKEKVGSKQFSKIEKVAESYRKHFKAEIDNGSVNPYETGLLLVFAYPERIASARPGNNAQFQLANGRLAMAHHSDDLAYEPWLAVAHLDARDEIGKIFLASPLNPKDLAPMVTNQEVITWDTKSGGLNANVEFRIGNILLQQKPLQNPDETQVSKAILYAIKNEGEQLLSFNDEVEQLQNRVSSLAIWNPENRWPDFSTPHLLELPEKWLQPYLQHIRKNEDLEKLNLKEILFYSLSAMQQNHLEKLAPERIEVPSGSKIKLKYNADGSAPILAVRLQEVFGMTESPKINQGKVDVLMHLLSPGFKLVQITSDLKSFWNDAYFEVKKEMKRRYPKHYWPENPLDAEAVRGVRRRK
jgi:ATP-dependent helicase HrpB